MNLPSTKPYLIRAIYEWCSDCGYTPLVSVKVNNEMNLPSNSISNGEIIFNIHPNAVHNLVIGNDIISFSARFEGIAREIDFPTDSVKGIFAREVNQGLAFPETFVENEKVHQKTNNDNKTEDSVRLDKEKQTRKDKTTLRLIK